MPLLIDGYNLLYISGILGHGEGPGGLQRSRVALLNFLAESLSEKELPRTTVVFDANDPPRGLPSQVIHRGINVCFAVGYESADELLEVLIRADHAPSRLTVVSSDHRVQRAAHRRRAKAIDSDVWFGALRGTRQRRRMSGSMMPARPAVPLLAEDVDYWIRQFGGESVLMDFLSQESAEGEMREDCQRSERQTSQQSAAVGDQAGFPGKSGRKPPGKNDAGKKTSNPDAARRRRRVKEPESEKPRASGFEGLDNPFPPGYGDDLAGEL